MAVDTAERLAFILSSHASSLTVVLAVCRAIVSLTSSGTVTTDVRVRGLLYDAGCMTTLLLLIRRTSNDGGVFQGLLQAVLTLCGGEQLDSRCVECVRAVMSDGRGDVLRYYLTLASIRVVECRLVLRMV